MGMTGAVIFGLAVSLAASLVVIGVIMIWGQWQLGKHRGVSREEFIRAFPDIPAELPGAVFDYYKSQVFAKEFSIAPDDDYLQVLSAGDEDIDDDERFLLKRLGLRLPKCHAAARAETTIRTIRDMVLWLHWLQQHQDN